MPGHELFLETDNIEIYRYINQFKLKNEWRFLWSERRIYSIEIKKVTCFADR